MLCLQLLPALFAQGQVDKVYAQSRGPVTIEIIGTTDMHANIWGYSYEDNKETTNNGMARIATFVEEERKANPGKVILVDNGDTFQGTILSDDLCNKQAGQHPIADAMNAMGYDAMTMGNHDFDFGLGLIERIQAQDNFPLLGANVKRVDGKRFVQPYTIVNREGVSIGIIGITHPEVPRMDGEKVDALTFTSVADGARAACDALKRQVDVIIAVAHVGLFAQYDEEHGTDAGITILDSCPEIDLLLLGHMHTLLNETINGVPVLACRNDGRDIAKFTITLDENNKITAKSGEIIDTEEYEPSATIREMPSIKDAHEKTIAFIFGGVKDTGDTTSGSIFGTSTARYQPRNEIKGIPEGKLRDTAVVDLINNVQLLYSGADVSACALFKDTSDLPEGPINYSNIFDIYKFDNTLYTVDVTGAELRGYMEWSAACYNQYKPGDISISFDPDRPSFLYDMFQGVDYQIDLSKPVGSRIVNIMFKGKPLTDDQVLKLAVNNYRYSSALKTLKLIAGKRDWESSQSIRDMLVDYITTEGTISPSVDNNWSIVGVNLSSPYREQVIAMVNEGKLEVPYTKSLNINELKAQGVIK